MTTGSPWGRLSCNAQSSKLSSSCKTHFITSLVKWQWQQSMLTKCLCHGCLKKCLVYTNQSNVHTILKTWFFHWIAIWGRVKYQTTVWKWMDILKQLGLGFLIQNFFPSATRFFQISSATVGNQGVRRSKNRRDSRISRWFAVPTLHPLIIAESKLAIYWRFGHEIKTKTC